ncbi:gamma-glutamylcyclotransferase [Sphingobacteriales bacterium UPWRP_1]|nr:hypothetical protein B6N25_04385 [Sphingobacteriales bacterium TSM_CSS]PSJ73495.1 gamma-glutamylcyclotransferase [Sphingobacteriales bacterium UPWRP_1]
MQQPAQHLFVYGTLMSAFTNPVSIRLRGAATFAANAYVSGLLYDVGTYPAFIATQNPLQKVYGELWLLPQYPDDLLALLDDYEGCTENSEPPFLYLRRQIPAYPITPAKNNPPLPAWTYVYNRSIKNLPHIDSGNYLQYLGNKKK